MHKKMSKNTKLVIGSPSNFWTWSPESGWDLTHPQTPDDAEPLQSRLLLDCEISNVAIDPAKTALMIIDLQNYTMCRAFRPDTVPAMYQAQDSLLMHGIPAARRAMIQIVWVNWGLTDEELETMTPGALRVFGFSANTVEADFGLSSRQAVARGLEGFIRCGETPTSTGLGADLGVIVLEDGVKVDAGKALMRDTWNAALHGPLLAAFEEGQAAPRPDVLLHKNRNSALWDATSECEQYLRRAGIQTILFAGANTDQCVIGTLQDAHAKGFDTILLQDGCATDSPTYAQQSVEWNCCRSWGFLSSCKALETAVFKAERESA
jgi:nicotinamidase-related amidase